MQAYTDGPAPPSLLQPGRMVFDREQSVADCAVTSLLLEAWLTAGHQTAPDSPPPSCIDLGAPHATD